MDIVVTPYTQSTLFSVLRPYLKNEFRVFEFRVLKLVDKRRNFKYGKNASQYRSGNVKP